MEAFLALRNAEDAIVSRVFAAANAAEAAREHEAKAALLVASRVRGYQQRRRYLHTRRQVLRIQTAYRVHRARLRAERMRLETETRERALLFGHFATAIQRVFRGCYTRKWVADSRARRRYLEQVQGRTEEVRAACQAHLEAQTAAHAAKKNDEYFDRFTKYTSQMLYLGSTASRAGVLANKLIDPSLRAAFGDTAESALRVHRMKFKPSLPARAAGYSGVPAAAAAGEDARCRIPANESILSRTGVEASSASAAASASRSRLKNDFGSARYGWLKDEHHHPPPPHTHVSFPHHAQQTRSPSQEALCCGCEKQHGCDITAVEGVL